MYDFWYYDDRKMNRRRAEGDGGIDPSRVLSKLRTTGSIYEVVHAEARPNSGCHDWYFYDNTVHTMPPRR